MQNFAKGKIHSDRWGRESRVGVFGQEDYLTFLKFRLLYQSFIIFQFMPITRVIHVEDDDSVAWAIASWIRIGLDEVEIKRVSTLVEAMDLLEKWDIPDSHDTCWIVDGNFPSHPGKAPTFNWPTLVQAIRGRMKTVLILWLASSGMDEWTTPGLDGSAQKPDFEGFMRTLTRLSTQNPSD